MSLSVRQSFSSADDPTASTVTMLLDVVRALVSDPSQVSLETVSQNGITVLLLKVGSGDLGRVIGKQGRTAQSLRVILQAIEMKTQMRFQLEIQQDVSVVV